jgi:hypothetical protein
MEIPLENAGNTEKQAKYQAEFAKLTALFDDVEPAQKDLVSGLIHDAAFLYAENWALRQTLEATGMIKVHPQHPEMQKPVEAARQYRQNVGAYAVIIKTLNGVLSKNEIEDDDDMGDYE